MMKRHSEELTHKNPCNYDTAIYQIDPETGRETYLSNLNLSDYTNRDYKIESFFYDTVDDTYYAIVQSTHSGDLATASFKTLTEDIKLLSFSGWMNELEFNQYLDQQWLYIQFVDQEDLAIVPGWTLLESMGRFVATEQKQNEKLAEQRRKQTALTEQVSFTLLASEVISTNEINEFNDHFLQSAQQSTTLEILSNGEVLGSIATPHSTSIANLDIETTSSFNPHAFAPGVRVFDDILEIGNLEIVS